MPKSNYLRNDPTSTFDAHLFDREQVEDAAAGADGEQTNKPVSSICSRTTSYGAFYAVSLDDIDEDIPDHEGGLCSVCRKTLESRRGDDA